MDELKKLIFQAINSKLDELIELVKDRPFIWDRSVDGYRNKEFCASAWREICITLFDTFDQWNEEQRMYVEKCVKQKWTTCRDIWQRTHRKKKEALQNGEQFVDIKNSVNYEKLKFLAKVYDKMDHLQTGKEEKIWDENVGNIDNPPSPQVGYNGDHIINLDNVDFQRNLLQGFMNTKKPHDQGPNKSSHTKKLENNVEANTKSKSEQGSSSQKPVVVNLDNKFKFGSLIVASKHRSSVNSRDVDKSTSNTMQSPKHEQAPKSPSREGMHLFTNDHRIVKSNSDPSPQKVEMGSPSKLVKDEDISNGGLSGESTIPYMQNISNLKRKSTEATAEQTPRKRTAHDEKPSNIQLEGFLQLIKPQIEDFSKPQMMDFFLEIVKPLIKDFDKHQMLDFQIEALQLIKKFEGN